MPIPPILDLFVVWHPADTDGAARFAELFDYFHSPAFSGLVGGAVEVYPRSAPWTTGAAPRPLGIDPANASLPAAQFNAIVPVIDVNLVRAIADEKNPWSSYFTEIAELNRRSGIGLYPMVATGFKWETTTAYNILEKNQALSAAVNSNSALLGRELAQGITQHIQQEAGHSKRLTVFISHTKHRSWTEEAGSVPAIYDNVREYMLKTKLDSFFDAQDIQPGDNWEKTLEDQAASSALLMIRTDAYAGRDWTQQEVHTAKKNAVPIVCMYALTSGEERGSFLMDHVPSTQCSLTDPESGIELAINKLVDEALKNALWCAQTSYLESNGFDWLPAQSPEPTTLVLWLAKHRERHSDHEHLWVIHPDPPLGPAERRVLLQLCAVAGYELDADIFTPRTFAARGGALER